jgi:uncharacterized membrane protein YhiD involved in acid resistance|tara:strand:+ start:196 stop:573 length:378 start_codon:yes stop_codon:yes gene_type:complete
MKYLTFKNLLIGYALLMSLAIGIAIIIGAAKLGQSSTIVVDASKYIKQELKSSQERNLAYDSQFQILVDGLIERDKAITELKHTLKTRNVLIEQLKIKSNEVPATINYTNEQHDSLFTDFIRGLN